MFVHVKTFNGFSLNGGGYACAGLDLHTQPSANPVWIEQASDAPNYAGVYTLGARGLPITIKITNYGDRWNLIQAMKAALKPGTTGDLVVTFPGGIDYRLPCIVQSLVREMTHMQSWVAVLQSGPADWVAVTPETSTWSITTASESHDFNVGGVMRTALSATITPTGGASGGWSYQNLYQLVAPKAIAFGYRPWCIQLDTAALVTASKMQADGDDLRVYVDGVEVRRWLADMNTDHTKVWINLTLLAGQRLKLKTGIAASGDIGEMVFEQTSDNAAALNKLPAAGLLVHGTEWIQYSGIDKTRYKLGVVKRGALGTTLQAHTTGSEFSWIQAPIWVVYGNSAATSPATDDAAYDDEKPVFDLSASSNTSWVYTASTLFYDADKPTRPGSWKPTYSRKGAESYPYWYSQDAESGTPAAGMRMGSYDKNGVWQPETATLSWALSCPGGISTVSITASKRRNSSAWVTLAGLQRSADGQTWSTVWNESTPVSVSTWTAITQSSKTITGNQKNIRVVLSGSLLAGSTRQAYLEMLTATVTMYSTNLPAGSLLGEKGNFPMMIRLLNSTTGDEILIRQPMLLNKTLTLDGEARTVMYDGVNAHGAITLDDESRDTWIELAPGNNTLEITTDYGGPMTVGLSWYTRQP
jgi:hypothetical protein